jgi:hypothetical protein
MGARTCLAWRSRNMKFSSIRQSGSLHSSEDRNRDQKICGNVTQKDNDEMLAFDLSRVERPESRTSP